MGFRNLKSFNKALVAKQLWRLTTRPQSLVARVFRARYYKNGDIMNAQVKQGASYIWRSLVWSRPLVQKGHRWRVGNGADIRLFEDVWVVSSSGGQIIERNDAIHEDLRVADIINQNGEWDQNKVEALLRPHEVSAVYRTPIAEHGSHDELGWRYGTRGEFSVKSAYLLDVGFYDPHPHTSSDDGKWWSKHVWNLSIPPKAKVFMWRALSNLIPTEANLKEHRVPVDGICRRCGDRWDSTEHSLVSCPMVRSIWAKSRFRFIMNQGKYLDLRSIAGAIRSEVTKEEYELWATMLWQIWSWSCNVKHDEQKLKNKTSEAECEAMWEAYQHAKQTVTVPFVMGMTFGERKWSKPKRGIYRVDVDAMFDASQQMFGVGIIARDHTGSIKLAAAKRTKPSSTAGLAEVMAVIHGVTASIEAGIMPISIHTDSMFAARVMAGPTEEREFLPEDLREIMDSARENLLVGVFHAYRSANGAAHSLAKFARSTESPCWWTREFPAWLEQIVTADLE